MEILIVSRSSPVDLTNGIGLQLSNYLKWLPVVGCHPTFWSLPASGHGRVRQVLSALGALPGGFRGETSLPIRNAAAAIWFGSAWDPIASTLASRSPIPLVWFPSDSITLAEERRTGRPGMKAIRIALAKRAERLGLESGFAAACYVAHPDADRASAISSRTRIEVASNGVDSAIYHPGVRRSDDCPTVLFAGVLNFGPNISACKRLLREIAPLIKNRCRIVVAGRSPSTIVREMVASTPNATLIPDPPEMADIYREADIFVAPMVDGSGFKNKIAEALASGLPVVASEAASIGSSHSCNAIAQFSDPAEAARLIDALIDEPVRRCVLAHDARRYAVERMSWRQSAERLFDVIRQSTLRGRE